MSTDFSFSRKDLDMYFKELGKEFRKLTKGRSHAEIILVGGASIAINYDFRDMTTDVDALIESDSCMKDAINKIRDNYGLSNGWLNDAFKNTASYSKKLRGVSKHYKTFSNVVHIMTISSEYLIAMKAMSGRLYKFDMSDIVGVLSAHKNQGIPISRDSINNAVVELYGCKELPESSVKFLDDVFTHGDYGCLYDELREKEKENKELLLDFEQDYPKVLNKNNINAIIEQARRKKESNE